MTAETPSGASGSSAPPWEISQPSDSRVGSRCTTATRRARPPSSSTTKAGALAGWPSAPAFVVHHVDEAPVGQLGNGEPGQRLERRFVFQRRAQDRAGLREKREPALGGVGLDGGGDDVGDGGEVVD